MSNFNSHINLKTMKIMYSIHSKKIFSKGQRTYDNVQESYGQLGIKQFHWKILSLYFLLLMITIPSRAQNKYIDDIFNKFEGREGVTTLNLSKDVLNLITHLDSGSTKERNMMAQISGVKIIGFEMASSDDKAAFAQMVKGMPVNDYKPLMIVKDKDANVQILLKESGGHVTEFLLLVTGDESTLVSISGNIERKELEKLSGMVKTGGLQHLTGLNIK
jgi:hypothetical protein